MIERIIIENFKSIRKLDLELKPINILVGANGAGKSNFISFFKLTNHIYEQKLQEYIGNNFDKLLYFGRKRSEYTDGLFDFENKSAFYFRLRPNIQGNSGYIYVSWFRLNRDSEKQKNYDLWSRLIFHTGGRLELEFLELKESEERESLYVKPAREFFQSFKIYHFHDTGSDSPMKRMNPINDNRNLRENGENLAAFLYYLQEKYPKEFQNIENQIRSVAPFFDRFDLAPDRLNESQIELRWLEKGSDAYFNAYDLSDGTLRFMALTTLLLQPDLPKTIIIDEPELGLHPFAINKLAAMMKQAAVKGSQVIVSTQSVNLVDNFEPEDVITVDRENDQSVFKRLNSEGLAEWLEDYTLGDLWNKNVIGARP
ncbi:MAG TPA: AAA family ATPase [Pyrinomonadaceae bacterium]|nr:AAA family ATPase [Pyrinomonadaceae bacterium]